MVWKAVLTVAELWDLWLGILFWLFDAQVVYLDIDSMPHF
jgi:hypothetical protein